MARQAKQRSRDLVEWDVFISHASEDKEEFVRPLAERLRGLGLRVWYDEFTLTVGDSLRRSIDRGLAQSRFGVVVISQSFLKKEWPQKELDGLTAREIDGVKVILPVWHKIKPEQVRAYSPTLMDRLAATSDKGLDYVTQQIMQAVRHDRRATSGDQEPQRIVNLAQPASKVPSTSTTRFEDLRKLATSLHQQRVEQIMKKPPIAILDGGALIMHVVPIDALIDRPSEAFEEISRNAHFFAPMGTTHARDMRINYDGLLTGSNAECLYQSSH
jgi:hypothetical protein